MNISTSEIKTRSSAVADKACDACASGLRFLYDNADATAR